MRISDWSSDVCSSDLVLLFEPRTDWSWRPVAHRAARSRQASRGRERPLPRAPGLLSSWWSTLVDLLRLRSDRSEEHTSELQSLMRISYAVFCLKNKTLITKQLRSTHTLLPSRVNEPCNKLKL